MATRDQNQHARGGLNHLRAWKRLTIVAWDGSVMCSTRYSTVQLLYSCCLYMTTPLHDINQCHDDSNSFTVSCLLVQYGMIVNLRLPLTFPRAEPEPISNGIPSVQAALIWHIMQRPQWLQINHNLVHSTHNQNDTAIPSITTVRLNTRTAEQHARWV